MKRNYLLPFFLLLQLFMYGQPDIILQPYASGFDRPLDIAHCGDERLFIVEQDGLIHIIDGDGNVLPSPFLDIDSRVGSSQNEQGLLGLAFHPDYLTNGYFFVNYTNNNGDSRISRFSVTPADPNQADPNSEIVLIEVEQPFGNHNGGCVKFGPDGYLYIGLGDGGSGGDPQNNGQTRTTMLGKMLRINVDDGDPYDIPAGNPFVDDSSTLDEIWALGLRNPWRFSFDRLTGDLWIGDVGQNEWEEIDFQPADSPGGENYGWRCYEGNHPFNTAGCDPVNTLTFPVAEYSNSFTLGCSVTGGFVYRGCEFPGLYGHYLFADYCSGRIWSVTPGENDEFITEQLANLSDFQYVSFGENQDGELFVAGLGNGTISRVTTSSGILTGTNETCSGNNDGLIDFSIPTGQFASILWEDGSTEASRTGLTAGTYSVTVETANNCLFEEEIEITTDVFISYPPVITLEGDSLLTVEPAGQSYQWLLNGEPIPSAIEPSYVADESGEYSVVVTYGECEVVSAPITIIITLADPGTLGLEMIRVTPNPFTERLHLTLHSPEEREIELLITDPDGKIMVRESWRVFDRFDHTIDMSNLPVGMYLMIVKTGFGQWTKKLLKI